MSTPLRKPDYEVFPSAQAKLQEHAEEFGRELLFEAQSAAKRERAGVVTEKHVDVAYDRVFLTRRPHTLREFAKLMGAALFGAFPGGFATALAAASNVQVVFYTALGFAGMVLIFWGFLDD